MIDQIIVELDAAYHLAIREKQCEAAVQAVTAKARVLGLMKDKMEITHLYADPRDSKDTLEASATFVRRHH